MAFAGAIPSDIRYMAAEIVGGWKPDAIWVGCSGNLTVERSLVHLGVPMHGSDVNFYSCVLGNLAAGTPLEVRVNPEHAERAGWLGEYLEDPASAAATVMICYEQALYFVKQHRAYDRVLAALQDQWPRMHEKTKAKVEANLPPLASFAGRDVFDWVDDVPQGDAIVTYPPFRGAETSYRTGSWKRLAELFSYEEPPYEVMDDERFAAYLDKVTERRHWLIGSNRPVEQLEGRETGYRKSSNRAVPIYLYASSGPLRMVRPRQMTRDVMASRLMPGQELGERLAITPIGMPEFSVLRSQYMNAGIRPGAADMPVLVSVDGVVIGCFAMSRNTKGYGIQADKPGCVYMLSDFPVSGSGYKHLAKLVLYAALSRESQLLCQQMTREEVTHVLTTAFTNKPVSMKYRGLFKLHSRKENDVMEKGAWWTPDLQDWNEYYKRKFDLNYLAELGHWTLAEGLETWRAKHGERAAVPA